MRPVEGLLRVLAVLRLEECFLLALRVLSRELAELEHVRHVFAATLLDAQGAAGPREAILLQLNTLLAGAQHIDSFLIATR